MGWMVAALGGAGAGWGARAVLARLRRPVLPPVGVCEAAVAGLWLLAVALPLPGWWLPVPCAVAWVAVVLVASDVRHRVLPNAVTLPAYPAAAVLVTAAALGGPGLGLAARAAAAGALLAGVHAAVHLAAPAQLGAGDVKLAGLVGCVLGAVSWSALLVGPVVAAVVTAALALLGRGRSAPHGPGLLAAALLAALFPAALFPAAGALGGVGG